MIEETFENNILYKIYSSVISSNTYNIENIGGYNAFLS